jgi:hypothetical protein
MHDAKWFHDRPRRTKRCERCGGCGTLEIGFALVPADHVTDAPEDAIRAFVVGAYDIFTACREAADIARKASRLVAFEFNGRCVVVRPNDDPTTVARQWWLTQYNETPEQSLARR